MYPTFCTYRSQPELADEHFAGVAQSCGLGTARPGLALSGSDDDLDVIVDVLGTVARMPKSLVSLRLAEPVILALMDAVEEAIEDTIETEASDATMVGRMEATLALMERTLENPA